MTANDEPVVYNPEVNSSASQCISTHEPRWTRPDDEHVNMTFLDHGREI